MKRVCNDHRIMALGSRSGHVLFNWVVFVFLVMGAACGFTLMVVHIKHQDELTRLREESAREARLASEEIERLKADVPSTGPAVDNSELVKLRGEVAELRRQQQLWQRTVAENRQLQEAVKVYKQASAQGVAPAVNVATLPPPAPEIVPQEGVNVGNLGDNDDPADATRTIPGAGQAPIPKDPQTLACIANLQGIAGAKAHWAEEFHKLPADLPQEAELFGLNKFVSQKPVCPSGGIYILGAVGEKPRCSIPGHAY